MWVLPTYDRPQRAQETLDSLAIAGCKSPGLVYLDGAINPGYGHLKLPNGWNLLKSKENKGVCAALNDVFCRFPDLPWYGFLTDDSLIRTPHWDQMLLNELEDFSIIHSADGWQSDHRIHGAVLFGGELLRALGWWVPPGLIHSFCDDVWEALAAKLNLRKYVPEVLVEHRHFGNGKTHVDASYIKAYSSFDADKLFFRSWKEKDFEQAIQRINARKQLSRHDRPFKPSSHFTSCKCQR